MKSSLEIIFICAVRESGVFIVQLIGGSVLCAGIYTGENAAILPRFGETVCKN